MKYNLLSVIQMCDQGHKVLLIHKSVRLENKVQEN
jgi:hypothetical protein